MPGAVHLHFAGGHALEAVGSLGSRHRAPAGQAGPGAARLHHRSDRRMAVAANVSADVGRRLQHQSGVVGDVAMHLAAPVPVGADAETHAGLRGQAHKHEPAAGVGDRREGGKAVEEPKQQARVFVAGVKSPVERDRGPAQAAAVGADHGACQVRRAALQPHRKRRTVTLLAGGGDMPGGGYRYLRAAAFPRGAPHGEVVAPLAVSPGLDAAAGALAGGRPFPRLHAGATEGGAVTAEDLPLHDLARGLHRRREAPRQRGRKNRGQHRQPTAPTARASQRYHPSQCRIAAGGSPGVLRLGASASPAARLRA